MGEIGFKGFRKGLICRDKQYTENTVFEEPDADVYVKGMHYCKDPLDVLDSYSFISGVDGNFNEFAIVEPLAEEKTNDGMIFCTRKLRIGAKLSFSEFIKVCVDFVIEKTKHKELGDNQKDGAHIVNSENGAQIGDSGHESRIVNSGYEAEIGSSGDGVMIGDSGHESRIVSSGDEVHIGSSGAYAHIGSSGDGVRVGSSGYYADIGSSGDEVHIGSSGDGVYIGSSGDGVHIGSSGNFATITSTGKYSVIMCTGYDCKAKAQIGSFITLAEWEHSEEAGCYIPMYVKTEKVDGEHIKPDTYYKLKNGEFVEADDCDKE